MDPTPPPTKVHRPWHTRPKTIAAGDTVTLNSYGDIRMDRSKGKWVGSAMAVVKVCKSGLYQVKTSDGTLLSVPKSNLDPLHESRP